MFVDTNGNGDRESVAEEVLRQHAALPDSITGTLVESADAEADEDGDSYDAGDDTYFSYGQGGFRRMAGGALPAAIAIVLCDDRGNARTHGGPDSSAARAVEVNTVGRGVVTRSIARIEDTPGRLPVIRRRATGSVAGNRARGFTLIEGLIALLVLSIGMLGIAALYVETLRAGRSAQVRTQAVTLAADLADRIRSNRVPIDAYTGAGLNARAIADLAGWNALIAAQLPGGSGAVRFLAGTATTPAIYTILVSWTEVGQATPITYELRLEI